MYVQGGRREGREKGEPKRFFHLGLAQRGREGVAKGAIGLPRFLFPLFYQVSCGGGGGKDEVGNAPPLKGHSSAAEGGRKMQQQPSRKICVAQVGSEKNTCRKGEKGFSLRFSPQRNSPKKHFHPIIVSRCNVCIVQWAHGFAHEICTLHSGGRFFSHFPADFCIVLSSLSSPLPYSP